MSDLIADGHVTKRKKFAGVPLIDRLKANPNRYVPTAFHQDFVRLNSSEVTHLFGRKGEPFGSEISYKLFWDKEEKKTLGVISYSMNCEGPPGAVHGGCLATTLDNVFGWQSSRVMGFGCVTLNLNVNYKKFVKLGGMVRVEVKTEKIDGRKLYMAGKLTNNISTIEDPQDVVIHCDSTALFYKRVPQAWTYDQAVKLFGPQSKLSQEEIVSILKHANQQSVHQQRLESNEQIVSKL